MHPDGPVTLPGIPTEVYDHRCEHNLDKLAADAVMVQRNSRRWRLTHPVSRGVALESVPAEIWHLEQAQRQHRPKMMQLTVSDTRERQNVMECHNATNNRKITNRNESSRIYFGLAREAASLLRERVIYDITGVAEYDRVS